MAIGKGEADQEAGGEISQPQRQIQILVVTLLALAGVKTKVEVLQQL